MAEEFVVEYLDPRTLTPNPLNWRQHPDRQKEALAASIGEHGWLSAPIYNRRTGRIVDGHARVEQAIGYGVEAIPVRVIDVSEEQERRILASFDRIGELRLRDDNVLAELLSELKDSEKGLPPAWSADEVDEILKGYAKDAGLTGGAGQSDGGSGDDEDPKYEVPERARSGDLWGMGRHRLIVGDSLDEAVRERLLRGVRPRMLLTDPPYGIGIVEQGGRTGGVMRVGHGSVGGSKPFAGNGKVIKVKKYPVMKGDDRPFDPEPYLDLAEIVVLFGANHYANRLPNFPRWLVWDKREGTTPDSFSDCEFAWTNQPGPARMFSHMWRGLCKASERGDSRFHPTQKPVALFSWIIELFECQQDILFDPFVGSGSSVLAAHRQGATMNACEIEPQYADVVLHRWLLETDEEAELLERIDK